MPDIAIHPDKPGIKVGGLVAKLFRLHTERGACQEDFSRLKAAIIAARKHLSDGGKIEETWIGIVTSDGRSSIFLTGPMILTWRIENSR